MDAENHKAAGERDAANGCAGLTGEQRSWFVQKKWRIAICREDA
jgi:hypothetical protein